MASGANSQPLGRFIPKAPAVVASESLLKPAYVAATAGAGTSTTTTRRSRFSDTPIPAPVISPGLVDRKSVSSRDFSRVEDSDYHRNGRGRGNDDADDSRSGFSKFGSPSASSDNNPSREGSAEPAKKKRKSRWAESSDVRSFIPGMPTIIPAHLTKEQEKAYLLQLQIEDYSRKLRTGDLGIPANAEERSPSPEPIYNHEGKRLNTRDMRTRRKLEDERHKLIQQMFELNPEYKPPSDYKAPLAKYTDKVVIPQDDHPEINFVGLLIGPRGNTLKQLEKDVGGYCKIIIRGKGSVKEGKLGRGNRDPLPGEDEPLHAYITGQSPEAVRGAVDRIKRILMEGIEVPEHQNDLRKQQLRELALLNGTLRDEMGPRCSNCGSTAHRTWNCPDKPNITHSIVCNRCGGTGHIAKDCKTDMTQQSEAVTVNMDDEYLSLMAELGQGGPAPPAKPKPTAVPTSNPQFAMPRPQGGNQSYQAVPPIAQYGNAPPSHQPQHQQQNSYHQPQQHNYQQQNNNYQQQQHQQNSYMQQQHVGYGNPPPPPPPSNGGATAAATNGSSSGHMQQLQQQAQAQYGGYYGAPPPPPPAPAVQSYGYGGYGMQAAPPPPPPPQWGSAVQPQQQQQPPVFGGLLPPPPPPASTYPSSSASSSASAGVPVNAFAGMASWTTLPPPPPPPPPPS